MKDHGHLRASRGGKDQRKVDQSRRDNDLPLMIFRLVLARRLVERIMQDGLLTSVYDWYVDLERVLSIVDGTAATLVEANRWLSAQALADEARALAEGDRAERGES